MAITDYVIIKMIATDYVIIEMSTTDYDVIERNVMNVYYQYIMVTVEWFYLYLNICHRSEVTPEQFHYSINIYQYTLNIDKVTVNDTIRISIYFTHLYQIKLTWAIS